MRRAQWVHRPGAVVEATSSMTSVSWSELSERDPANARGVRCERRGFVVKSGTCLNRRTFTRTVDLADTDDRVDTDEGTESR